MAASSEIEVLAQELSNLAAKVLALEKRMTEVEAVIERLESAAATKPAPWRKFRRIGTPSIERCGGRSS
jgi:hypothetical protein